MPLSGSLSHFPVDSVLRGRGWIRLYWCFTMLYDSIECFIPCGDLRQSVGMQLLHRHLCHSAVVYRTFQWTQYCGGEVGFGSIGVLPCCMIVLSVLYRVVTSGSLLVCNYFTVIYATQ